MNRLVKTFKYGFQKMISKPGWDTIYVLVDMHETVLVPTWSTAPSETIYPKAVETLRLMSQHPNIKLILWSSSLPETNLKYQREFKERGVIFSAINANPFEEDTVYADFKSKPYMSVILDDKAGFDAKDDWEALYDYFISLKAFDLLYKAHHQLVKPHEKQEVDKFFNELIVDSKYLIPNT